MSYILNIDTATETAHISLAENGVLIETIINNNQKDHAAFLQPAAAKLMAQAGLSFNSLGAIAVTAGPGSYTGLRVGMASAKGLCFALNKPLIAINTLLVMAKAAQLQTEDETFLYCPMIDARRMEVFTALYNGNGKELMPPAALVLDENSYSAYLEKNKLLFFGSGSLKWKGVVTNKNAFFCRLTQLPKALASTAYQYYTNNHFADLAYTEPFYIKEFKDNM